MANTIKIAGDYDNEKYGRDHVAQIVTFGTMAARAAVRDVGRVMGMTYQDVDRVAKLIPATLYAGGDQPTFVKLPMKETTLALRHTNALFSISFGGQTKLAVVKDVQRNPVKRIVEHIDFYEVKAGEDRRRGAGVRRGHAEGCRRRVRRPAGAQGPRRCHQPARAHRGQR